MMTTRLIVRIVRRNTLAAVETRTFSDSLVSVGSSTTSSLRLEHPLVSPNQGVFMFTPTLVQYMDCSSETNATADGSPIEPGVPLPLREDTLIQIGPFALCAELQVEGVTGRTREPAIEGETMTFAEDTMGVVRAVALASRDLPANDIDTLKSFVSQAVRLVDAFSAFVVRQRSRPGQVGMRSFDTSPLRNSWDSREISDYLLDMDAADSRLAELERYLVELAGQCRFPLSTTVGQA
jgi:hypothetical protein